MNKIISFSKQSIGDIYEAHKELMDNLIDRAVREAAEEIGYENFKKVYAFQPVETDMQRSSAA